MTFTLISQKYCY